MDAGRVHEDHLGIRPGQDASQWNTRRLRLRRDDRDLLAEQRIEQCGFADVRLADKGDEAGPEVVRCLLSVVRSSLLLISCYGPRSMGYGVRLRFFVEIDHERFE